MLPSSPYSASKASSDLLALSYHRTYGLDVVVTRCSNNFGPYQFPEKVIPLFVTNLIEDKPVPLYGDGLNVRDWLHVDDHCVAVLRALEHGEAGEIYNIGGDNERTNLELTYLVLELMGKSRDFIKPVIDRPGHDRRYAIDSSKIRRELGWERRRRPSRTHWRERFDGMSSIRSGGSGSKAALTANTTARNIHADVSRVRVNPCQEILQATERK